MKALIAFLSLSLVAMAVDAKACDVQAFNSVCGVQQQNLGYAQQFSGGYGVQQVFVQPQRIQRRRVQRVIVQQPVVIRRPRVVVSPFFFGVF